MPDEEEEGKGPDGLPMPPSPPGINFPPPLPPPPPMPQEVAIEPSLSEPVIDESDPGVNRLIFIVTGKRERPMGTPVG